MSSVERRRRPGVTELNRSQFTDPLLRQLDFDSLANLDVPRKLPHAVNCSLLPCASPSPIRLNRRY